MLCILLTSQVLLESKTNPDSWNFYFGEKSTDYIIPDSYTKRCHKKIKVRITHRIECDDGDRDNSDRRAGENLALWKPKGKSKLVMHLSIHDWNKEYSRQKESK